MQADKVKLYNNDFIEKLSRSDLISLLKQEIENRLYLEEHVISLENIIKRVHEQKC